MRIPPKGYLTLALLCGELACVAWIFTGVFSELIVGLAAGMSSVLAAMCWRN
jgi:hypothetical protein